MTTAYRKVPCGHEPTDYPHSMPNDDGSVDCDGFTYEPWPEIAEVVKAARKAPTTVSAR